MLVLAFWAGSFSKATDVGITDIIQQSLQSGSAQQLAAHFDTNIELIIDTESVEFSSVQATHAEFILKSFFRKHPPQRFQYVYQGIADNQHYSTGTYQSGHDRFQVYVFMRGVRTGRETSAGAHHYLINTLHFRKAN